MAKMEGLVGFDLTQSLPLPNIVDQLQQPVMNTIPGSNGIPLGAPGGFPMSMGRLSVSQNGIEMLRSLSLSGPLMLPSQQQPDAAEGMWERRPSGRVYNEEETSWMMDDRS